jgi:hypothetical protein
MTCYSHITKISSARLTICLINIQCRNYLMAIDRMRAAQKVKGLRMTDTT